MVEDNERQKTEPEGESFHPNAQERARGTFTSQKKSSLTKIGGVLLSFIAIYIASSFANLTSFSYRSEGEGNGQGIIFSRPSAHRSSVAHYMYCPLLPSTNRFITNLTMDGEDVEVDIRLKSPFTAVIAGPTGSGKTVLMKRLIDNRENVSDTPPQEVIYCYGVWQEAFDNMANVTFREGMIDFKNDIPSDGKHRWMIIDDLMSEMSGNDEADSLFTKYSHHKNVSVFFLVQNFFMKGSRTITLNSHYLFLFKNPRDASQMSFLARQLFPENPKFLVESYKDATRQPHSFLTLDLKQSTDEEMRVLGNYFPADPSEPIEVYTPK